MTIHIVICFVVVKSVGINISVILTKAWVIIQGTTLFVLLKNKENAKATKDKPTCIVAHTIKGKGVSFTEDNYAWHGAAPNKEQYEQAMKDLKEAK